MKLEQHRSVAAYLEARKTQPQHPTVLDAAWLKELALECGADDAGMVDLTRPAMTPYREDLQNVLPGVKAVLVLAFRVHQPNIRSTAHSLADLEFKHSWLRANKVGRELTDRLMERGIGAVNPPAGFPYEASLWPGKMWLTCDKFLAEQAGLGRMGWNRLVLHPKFGACMVLGNVLLPVECSAYDQPLDYDPCLGCGLCLKACPVGATQKGGGFGFMSCYTHNYRERLGGFSHWVEQIADSKDRFDYRRRVSDQETVSMWQHLAIGAQTRCDRCMAICPAGDMAVGEYYEDRKGYVQRYLKPWQELAENIYVVKGSDAADHLAKSHPHKKARCVSNGIRPQSAASFISSLSLSFQPGQAEGLNATYHFSFHGAEELEATVEIKDGTIGVEPGIQGEADLAISADSQTWTGFLSGERKLLWALLGRKIKLKGPPKLMKAFGACFPS